jgi:PAS domain-containing protein
MTRRTIPNDHDGDFRSGGKNSGLSMGTVHNLTLRTATAVGRLAELQRRAERLTEKPSPITKTALTELATALQDLQVANEALQSQLDELNSLRTSMEMAQHTMDEFAQAMPVAALWTDRAGVIEKGNDAASQLLNIGKHHLQNKSLMLFITDRSALFAALHSLCEADRVSAVDIEVTVRPRERRPRRMRLCGRRLQHDARCVWFLHDGPSLSAEANQAPDIHGVV